MKKITSDQSKIDLVAKLVKEGTIDFVDAIKLLEVETVTEYITVPFYDHVRTISPPWAPMPTFVTTELTTNLFSYTN